MDLVGTSPGGRQVGWEWTSSGHHLGVLLTPQLGPHPPPPVTARVPPAIRAPPGRLTSASRWAHWASRSSSWVCNAVAFRPPRPPLWSPLRLGGRTGHHAPAVESATQWLPVRCAPAPVAAEACWRLPAEERGGEGGAEGWWDGEEEGGEKRDTQQNIMKKEEWGRRARSEGLSWGAQEGGRRARSEGLRWRGAGRGTACHHGIALCDGRCISHPRSRPAG